jgi:anti-anti-sigma regulatory factor
VSAERSTPGQAPNPSNVFDAELRMDLGGDCLALRGVVDAISAPLLRDDLTEALRTTAGRRLSIDLSDVVHLSAAGVAVLDQSLKAARPPLLILVADCAVRTVLDLCAVPYQLVATTPAGRPGPRRTRRGGQHRAPHALGGPIRLTGLVRGLLP